MEMAVQTVTAAKSTVIPEMRSIIRDDECEVGIYKAKTA